VSRVANRVSILLVALLALGAVLTACKEDNAAITTPSGGGLETPTRTQRPSTTETEEPTATATGSEEQLDRADQLVEEIIGELCGAECPDGSGEFQPADILANVPDLVVPGTEPDGTSLVTGVLGPGSAGATVSSVKDATAVLVYVSDDGEAWVTLAEGPDTRTAPAEGEQVDLGGGIAATIVSEDEDSGTMEWLSADSVLFLLEWSGMTTEDATDFATSTVD